MDFLNNIQPIILAGGMGTRLSPVVSNLPKIMAPVLGRPFITYIFDQLLSAGFSQVILCTGYMAEIVENDLGYEYNGLKIIYSHEEKPLGTGGAFRLAASRQRKKQLLLMNGDSYLNFDLKSFVSRHFDNQRGASIILAEMSDSRRFGQVTIDVNHLVTGFKEKELEAGRGLINAGIYLISTELLLQILTDGASSMELDFFPAVAGKDLYGFTCNGKFIDIGLPETYSEAEEFFSYVF